MIMSDAAQPDPTHAEPDRGAAFVADATRHPAVDAFVEALRAARAAGGDERDMLARVAPSCARLAARRAEWLRPAMCQPDPEQGFSLHVLHEESDHALAVFVVTWLPGRSTMPHDHGTWAVIAGLEGTERNALWERLDDRSRPGHADLRRTGERSVGPGELILLPANSIHSVVNDTDEVTVSLHAYGRHVNYNVRSQFDPDAHTESPYQVRIQS
jgi:predicted metal-dependent enzyme (double-stranded beta helix superfamily)